MNMNTRNIILLIIFFGGSVDLYSQTDSINFKLKDSENSRSFNFGTGIFAHSEYYKHKIAGLYFTCSYNTKINKYLNWGIGADYFNGSENYIKSYRAGIFLNPFFKLDVLNDKLSLIAGLEALLLLEINKGDENSMYCWPMVNIKCQYNVNKIFSIGIEYKTVVIYPYLLNGYLSYNF